jgi:hypothetical protein
VTLKVSIVLIVYTKVSLGEIKYQPNFTTYWNNKIFIVFTKILLAVHWNTLAFGLQLMLNPCQIIEGIQGTESTCLLSLSLYVSVCVCVLWSLWFCLWLLREEQKADSCRSIVCIISSKLKCVYIYVYSLFNSPLLDFPSRYIYFNIYGTKFLMGLTHRPILLTHKDKTLLTSSTWHKVNKV